MACARGPATPASSPSATSSPSAPSAPSAPAAALTPDPPPSAFERDGEDILGGATSIEIQAPSYAVMAALEHNEAAWHILPHVAGVEDMGEEQGDQLLRVTHSFGIFSGGYVLRLRREWKPSGRHLIRFWVDTRFPRSVEDARGYFEAQPLGSDRTMLHYHVEAVLLPGLLRMFLRDKIQWALMVVPERARTFVERERDASGTSLNDPNAAWPRGVRRLSPPRAPL